MVRKSILMLAFMAGFSSFQAGALAQDWQAGADVAWGKVFEAAKKEGKVVVAGPPQLARVLSDEFKKDTGIELEYLGGNTRDLSSRFDREAAAGNPSIDVFLSGGDGFFTVYAQGQLKSIKSLLMLPGVTNPKNWLGGDIKWVDNDKAFYLQGTNWVFGWPVANANLVKPGSLTSWHDLLKPEFKGKIASIDVASPGPGRALGSYLLKQFGPEFVKKLFVDQGVVLTRDGRQLVDWVTRGNYVVALGAVQADVEYFRSRGIRHLDVPVMMDGQGTVLGGFSVMRQPKANPHPNAATVFANWYASRPGQVAFSRAMLEPSSRLDADLADIPDYVKLKPGYQYFDQYRQDFITGERVKLEESVVQILGGR